MIAWFRRQIRKCLQDLLAEDLKQGGKQKEFWLSVRTSNGFELYKAKAVYGLNLVCQRGNEERIVRSIEAKDADEFADVWDRLAVNGGLTKATWEDGTPCNPSDLI